MAHRTASNPSYELCMMRHGIAVPRGTTAFANDADRPLAPKGRQRLKEIGHGLARLAYAPQWILSSPLVRARETASLVAEALGVNCPLDCSEALCPGGSLDALLELLARHPERSRVLVVGHETDLSEMAAQLISASRQARLGFKKGGACLIRFDRVPPRPPGELRWWLTPRILRALAKA